MLCSTFSLFLLTDKLKGKGNKRDGTPDKPTTPGADGEDGGSEGRPTILNDEEIQSLAIKPDALDKVWLASFNLGEISLTLSYLCYHCGHP